MGIDTTSLPWQRKTIRPCGNEEKPEWASTQISPSMFPITVFRSGNEEKPEMEVNHTSFKTNLSFDEIQDVLLFSLDKSINDVLNELISKISGDHTKVVKLDFDLAKSKLDFNSYYRLVNVFYKKVFLDKVSLLVKVKDYIDGRQMCSQDNIESLLSL